MSRNDNGRSLNMVSSNGNGEGQQATARHFTDAEVERNVSEIVNKVKSTTNEMDAMRSARRDGGSAKTDAVDAAVEGVARDVADWRKTECVIEGPDKYRQFRIRHVPTSLFWYGGDDASFVEAVGYDEDGREEGRYYFGAPGTDERGCGDGPADKVLASIPDSARPIVAAPIAPPHVPVIEQGENGKWRVRRGGDCLGVYGFRWYPMEVLAANGFIHEDQARAEMLLRTWLKENPSTPSPNSDASVRPDAFDGGCPDDTEQVVSKFLDPQAGEGAPLAPSPASSPSTVDLAWSLGFAHAMVVACGIVSDLAPSDAARACRVRMLDESKRRTGPGGGK